MAVQVSSIVNSHMRPKVSHNLTLLFLAEGIRTMFAHLPQCAACEPTGKCEFADEDEQLSSSLGESLQTQTVTVPELDLLLVV